MKRLHIIFPVLNEEERLEKGIRNTVVYLEKLKYSYLITIIDNGSSDNTAAISELLCKEYRNVRYLYIAQRGVGAAFRTGIDINECEIVGYMDIDLSTNLNHIQDMMNIFESDNHVDIINASRYSRDSVLVGRKWYRNIVSYFLVYLLKITLKMKASDAICGFKFFRKDVVEALIKSAHKDDGWFYLIELLIRAEREGYNIVELPVEWVYDDKTKVKVLKVTLNYMKQIIRLKKEL